jgi:hypothetical protein
MFIGSRNLGFSTIQIDGTTIRAPIRHAKIDTITRRPKNLTGIKVEKSSAINPIITEKALKTIPLPVVVRVFFTAS